MNVMGAFPPFGFRALLSGVPAARAGVNHRSVTFQNAFTAPGGAGEIG
jgi:hypothetical protein